MELEHRNFKNKMHIDTYLCSYERKIRKKNKKESSDRSYRSAAKTAKKIDKADDFTIFQQKIDSMHNIPTRNIRNSDHTRKNEGFLELPAITVRHLRKTTTEK
jgi:hypothetical protein